MPLASQTFFRFLQEFHVSSLLRCSTKEQTSRDPLEGPSEMGAQMSLQALKRGHVQWLQVVARREETQWGSRHAAIFGMHEGRSIFGTPLVLLDQTEEVQSNTVLFNRHILDFGNGKRLIACY